jgi:hypothetical protein
LKPADIEEAFSRFADFAEVFIGPRVEGVITDPEDAHRLLDQESAREDAQAAEKALYLSVGLDDQAMRSFNAHMAEYVDEMTTLFGDDAFDYRDGMLHGGIIGLVVGLTAEQLSRERG